MKRQNQTGRLFRTTNAEEFVAFINKESFTVYPKGNKNQFKIIPMKNAFQHRQVKLGLISTLTTMQEMFNEDGSAIKLCLPVGTFYMDDDATEDDFISMPKHFNPRYTGIVIAYDDNDTKSYGTISIIYTILLGDAEKPERSMLEYVFKNKTDIDKLINELQKVIYTENGGK